MLECLKYEGKLLLQEEYILLLLIHKLTERRYPEIIELMRQPSIIDVMIGIYKKRGECKTLCEQIMCKILNGIEINGICTSEVMQIIRR